MKLSEVKTILANSEKVDFILENGQTVPKHFHVTEVGIVRKNFIDCGGTVRTEQKANFQLWNATDYDHRLEPSKLLNIIHLSEQILGLQDLEIEIEYQADTIGKYGLEYQNGTFVLTSTQTACLAFDSCGIPTQSIKQSSNSCTPGGGCC